MNKNKKLAVAVVSTVMAGTMVFSLAACNPTTPVKPGPEPEKGSGKDLYGIIDKDTGNINYGVYGDRDKVTLNLAVGHEGKVNSTAFQTLQDEITLPDGKKYNDGNLKPAWAQMGEDLNITFNDVWDGTKAADNLGALTKVDSTGHTKYENTDLFTSDLSKIVEAKTTSFLNLADYLDYMPHFKAFLEANPVVYLSLLQEGMETTGADAGKGQTIYVAPYFDGYNDIERYCLIRQDWADKLLNGDTATTGSVAFDVGCRQYNGNDKTLTYNGISVQPYMQGTGKLAVDSANADGTAVIKIVKNYDNVVAEIKKDGTPLKAAYEAIAGAAYTGTSGNIVAIQNAALTANPKATGDKLVDLFRAYVDACYQTEDGKQYYAADKRSNLFNGYDACWDVDDLVAMLRCVMTNASALGSAEVGGITPREGNNNRTPDLIRLGGQLYGVRGTASTLEYDYIDSEGNLHDARNDAEFYTVAENMNALFKEGLIANFNSGYDFTATGGIITTGSKSGKEVECFMEWDYSQTQTQYGFYMEDKTISGAPDALDKEGTYRFGAIVTPVAKWDVDGDGNHTDVMRFSESWRSTKTGGLAANGAIASNPDKLKATLQFIDYLYSSDGQIVSTFGPKGDAEGKGGFWYGKEATQEEINAGNYFIYKGVKYSGYDYKGKITPKITTDVYDSFRGKSVNNWKVSDNSNVTKAALSFTNYARYLVGSTLPVGVKDQSFENQLTSKMGEAGATKVSTGLALGTIKGMSLDIDENNWWYTCVPSGLPISDEDNTDYLKTSFMTNYKHLYGDTKNSYSIMAWIILYGTDSTYSCNKVEVAYTSTADLLTKQIDKDKDAPTVKELTESREYAYGNAWDLAKDYWNYIKSTINND
ncbi:MAG: hypothetical protein K2K80_05815 [Clostridia bacterium]|nr:hypothetical protein [Clostridia bacterium]